MVKIDQVIVPLKVLLVLVFAGLLVAQLLSLPGQFSHMAAEHPERGVLPWLMLAVAVLEAACFQVVIVCIWRLLDLVRDDRIFSERAFHWVDAIVWAMVVGWLLLAGLAATLVTVIYVTPELRDPGLPILLTGMVLIGAVVVLTMVVMRVLLRRATVLRSDLDEVI
ncbi:DUF2975 domain-containing protein [Agromyces sp. NPDC058104]|uniref:DUF2975 domain-containing protein n=1 Tax=Agromyces sp. NPDC058104 TaxID=3346342 RepID=UPI0036DD938F